MSSTKRKRSDSTTEEKMDIEVDPPVVERGGIRDTPKDSLPWVEKYRPTCFDELISHDNIITTLDKLIQSNRLPHLLFYGPPGTGKTSTIHAVAKKMNGTNWRNLILELNASDDRKIGVVREQIKDFASTKRIFDTGIKLIILDEADAMTNDAQAALRRVIEKYTSNTRFCLIANHVNKITPAIQSRCTKFRFGPLDNSQITPRLDHIIKVEKLNVTDDGSKALLRLANGDMRKVINVLQSTSMAFDAVTEETVYSCTGNPLPKTIQAIITWMLNDDFQNAFNKILATQVEEGLALTDILRDVHQFLAKIRLDDETLIMLYDKLSLVEQRLAAGGSDKLQLGAMVSAFQGARQMVAEKAKKMDTD